MNILISNYNKQLHSYIQVIAGSQIGLYHIFFFIIMMYFLCLSRMHLISIILKKVNIGINYKHSYMFCYSRMNFDNLFNVCT